jgi:NTP pyrophosphatase (non-canonical NTP hydrolase)
MINDNFWQGILLKLSFRPEKKRSGPTRAGVGGAMNVNITHADLVRSLVKDGDAIAGELTGNDAHLLHMAVGVSTEAGELLDAVKKATIYRKPIDCENIIEELGDIEFYLEGIRQAFAITRETVLFANIAKLRRRYHEGRFTNEQAQARADKSPLFQQCPNCKQQGADCVCGGLR